MQLAVNEIFGPTVQGEGPSLGRRAVFLRLAMCNLKCSWCDTPYTWDWEGINGTAYSRSDEVHLREVDDVRRDVLARIGLGRASSLLVITGGEPLLQQRALMELAQWRNSPAIEVETNGTIVPGAIAKLSIFYLPVYFNISPKLANSGNALAKRLNYNALEQFVSLGARSRFKFVVSSRSDLDEVDKLVEQVHIPYDSVWIMPEGRHQDEIQDHIRLVADAAIARGYNLTTRLHIEVWADQRGK